MIIEMNVYEREDGELRAFNVRRRNSNDNEEVRDAADEGRGGFSVMQGGVADVPFAFTMTKVWLDGSPRGI